MATYGPDDIKLEFDVTTGGALQDITSVVQSFNGMDIQAAVEDGAAFGSVFQQFVYSKFKTLSDVTLDVFYDDTAGTGTNAVFNNPGDIRTFKTTWGGAKTTSVETIIKSFARIPARGKLLMARVVLTPTGDVTEA